MPAIHRGRLAHSAGGEASNSREPAADNSCGAAGEQPAQARASFTETRVLALAGRCITELSSNSVSWNATTRKKFAQVVGSVRCLGNQRCLQSNVSVFQNSPDQYRHVRRRAVKRTNFTVVIGLVVNAYSSFVQDQSPRIELTH
jgi:hypothetical protein